MTECNICCETFNKSTHKDVGCSENCGVGACRDCVQKYILSNAPHEPSCMGCKTVWPTKFLEGVMTKKFMTKEVSELTNQRVFEQQQMHFPATQQAIVRDRLQKSHRAANVLYQRTMISLRQHLKSRDVRYMTPGDDMAAWLKTAEFLNTVAKPQYDEFQRLSAELRGIGATVTVETRTAAQFVKGCCREGCRGFLNRAWNCGVCELASCSKCHEAKDEDHECDPDNVATVALLASDTKRCPKCACNITKIAGCDHMWCTNCNTGFSWRSGLELDNSRQTNPLYYEFMRRTQGSVPRTLGDDGGGCVEVGNAPPNWSQMNSLNRCCTFLAWRKRAAACKLGMYAAMVRHIHLTEVRRDLLAEDDGESLRIRYLLGKTTKKSFIQTARRRETQAIVKSTVRNTLTTFVSLVSERLNTVAAMFHGPYGQRDIKRVNIDSVLATITEIDEITKMTNKTFDDSDFTGKYYFKIRYCVIASPNTMGLELYDSKKAKDSDGKDLPERLPTESRMRFRTPNYADKKVWSQEEVQNFLSLG